MTTILSTLAVAGALVAAPAMAQPDNTNSRTAPHFNTWMHDYSKTNHGRISREAYMNEAGRRWDMMDAKHEGLTTDQINSMYGYGPTPNRVNKGGKMTNPTGTELQGQNSGGK
ncbi:MAG: hypothetical protein ABI190_08345 [Casimicrobiaceae bacterium]